MSIFHLNNQFLPPAYDSLKESGVYDQLPAEIKAQLPLLAQLPASVQTKAQAAMAEELAKPETQTKLMKEVTALGDSAVKVDEAFERVRVGLSNVDQNSYKDKHNNPITKFEPIWVGYQKRWTTLLWGSRDAATKTEAYIKDFVEVVVAGVEEIKTKDDLEDARLDLSEFIKRKDPFGEKLNSQETVNVAEKYSQEFTDLRRDLEKFKDSFDDFARDHAIELQKDIKTKEAEIKRLDVEIAQCNAIVGAVGIALGVTPWVAFGGAVGALAALGPVGPFVAIGILIVGIVATLSEMGTLIAYSVKLDAKKEEREAAQNKLDNLKAQLKDLEMIKATLMGQKADIIDICARLDRFAAIWGIVRHDAELINSELAAAVSDEGSKRAFKHRVELIKNSYTHLGEALGVYATNISSSSAKTE